MRNLLTRIGISIFILNGIGQAGARTYNYEDVPMGERSFGMGHACMAISGDVANMFYNPATLAYGESSQVSAALSAYARIDTRTGEYVSLFKSARENISRGGFLAIPSMVGGNIKWGSWQWGGAVLVPFMFDNSGSMKISAGEEAAFQASFGAVWMGAFVARKFGSHNAGLSIFYASQEIEEQFLFRNSASSMIRSVIKDAEASGLVFVAGGTYDFNEDIKVGYSLRPPALSMGGLGEFSDVTSGSPFLATRKFKSNFLPIPGRLSVGLSWQATPKLLVASDLHYYLPVKGNFDPEKSAHFGIDAKNVLNLMIGAEYFVWKDIGVRMGLYSNMSAARTVPLHLTAIDDKVHMFGGTAAIVFDKANGSISIGGYLLGGQGLSTTLDATPTQTERSNYVYGAVIGSNYKF